MVRWSVKMERLLGWCPREVPQIQMARKYALTLKYLTIESGSIQSLQKQGSSNSCKT